MTIIDHLLLGVFVVAGLYTFYRLLVGWLRTRSHELEIEILSVPERSTSAREGSLAPETRPK